MPRTNTKEKLINAVMEITAEIGIENVTVKKIAEKLDIAEATLYRHFSGIEELLCETMITADKRVSSVCLREWNYNKTKGIPFSEASFRIWRQVFRFLLNNKRETLFMIRFRYSSMYTADIRAKRNAHNGVLAPLYKDFIEEIGVTQEDVSEFVLYLWFVTLGYAERLITFERKFSVYDEAHMWNSLAYSFNDMHSDAPIVLRRLQTKAKKTDKLTQIKEGMKDSE